jgi:hypothetical protein
MLENIETKERYRFTGVISTPNTSNKPYDKYSIRYISNVTNLTYKYP